MIAITGLVLLLFIVMRHLLIRTFKVGYYEQKLINRGVDVKLIQTSRYKSVLQDMGVDISSVENIGLFDIFLGHK